MSHRLENRLPDGFWERVTQAHHVLLMLDYDGTLAPLQIRRDRALPLPGVVTALQTLSETPGTTVGVLSGRTVGELYRLLVDPSEEPLDRLQLIGEHGWEWSCGDEILMHPIPAHVSELLACAERGARQMGFGRLLERKRTSIVLHTRSLSPVDSRWIERACAASWKELTCTGEMRLDEIDGGLELRVMGRDKGTTLSELASGAPDGPLMLYVGDDETDEDAFRAIRGRGFGLRVVRGPCLTTADGTLASCQEVVRWLDALCLATRARSAIDAARTLAGIEGTSDTIARLAATNGGVSCDGIRSHRRQR